eukprot:3750852-Rhodomonas_salina.1
MPAWYCCRSPVQAPWYKIRNAYGNAQVTSQVPTRVGIVTGYPGTRVPPPSWLNSTSSNPSFDL